MNKNNKVCFLSFQINIKTINTQKNESFFNAVNKMRRFLDYSLPNNFIFNSNYDHIRDEMVYTIFMISKKNFKLSIDNYNVYLKIIDIEGNE